MRQSILLAFLAAGPAIAEWDHSLYTSSPPVYPSPKTHGTGWEDGLQKAKDFVSQMTLEEKAWMVTGTSGPCVGNIAPIERLGFKGLCLQDGPLAIRQALLASVFPAGISAAASWDKDLLNLRGQYMGAEFKGKGSHIALGPVVGPLGRSAFGGRNWEGFSPDPYLSGVCVEETIEGMQKAGVQACVKHYIGNEQETQRNPDTVDGETVEAVSSNIDDRTMHESYLWPFANAIRAGSASVMCSYNRLNESYGCQNSKTLNGLLKTELGFQGYVMSDWGAVHTGVAAIKAGLDMNMPGGIDFVDPEPSFFGRNISIAVNNGSLPIARVNDMIVRILTPYFHLGQDQNYPAIDPTSADFAWTTEDDWVYQFNLGASLVDVRDHHAQLIRQMGAAGTVLLKNTKGALPLKAPKVIGVFGDDAADQPVSAQPIEILDQSVTGDAPSNDPKQSTGTLAVGGGSGTGRLSYVVSPLDAIRARARADGSLVQYVTSNELILDYDALSTIDPDPDVCVVFLKTFATEGYDRNTLLPESRGAKVVTRVASTCANTVVVLHGTGPNTLPFANNPNVTAIVAAHFPGQETGHSIADILYGDVNPSGKLPYTIAKKATDYKHNIVNETGATDPNAWQADFTERQLIDYHWFDAKNIAPRYEFGFGLSYTTFSLAGLQVSASSSGASRTPPQASASLPPGGNDALWQTVATVSATLTNTGDVAGATVPQLYVSLGDEAGSNTPVRSLRGFEKVMLQPGESQAVQFDLMRRDVSFWDINTQEWVIPSDGMEVMMGFSSRDLPLKSALKV